MSDEVRALGRGREDADDPFFLAFHASRTPMMIIDARQPNRAILFANDALAQLTGYPPSELIGRGGDFLQGPDPDPAELSPVGDASADRGAEIEVPLLRKNGSPLLVNRASTQLTSRAGEALYMLVTLSSPDEHRTRDTIREVALRTRELQQELDERTALLHEVDHRVKNSLQVISSLVLLKARRVPDPSTQRAFHSMAERITALATVHRLLHTSGDVSRLDLGAFVASFCDDLMSAVEPGRIALRLALDPIGVSAAKATPLALLINELATNALRHAFPDGRRGTLAIAARKTERGMQLAIEDDGVGLGTEAAEEGFGRALIDMLVRQLRGRLTWEDVGPGTRAVVDLPLAADEAAGR